MAEDNTFKFLKPEGTELSLDDYFDHLKKEMAKAMDCGIRGVSMVQRAEGDLRRLMNSAYLNLTDLVYDHQKKYEVTHACELNRAMDGTCLVCGKKLDR